MDRLPIAQDQLLELSPLKSGVDQLKVVISDLKSTTKAEDIEFGKAKIKVNEEIKISIKPGMVENSLST